MKVPNVIVRIGRCYRSCLPVHVCFARKADKTGLDSIERFANKIAELSLFPALAVAIGWQFSPERFNNARKAAVAQPVEQRIRNSVAAVSSHSVVSQQILNCLKNQAHGSHAVPAPTGQCYRVG